MIVTAYFASSGTPATGLSPTITGYKVSDNSVVINAQAMTEIASGYYKFSYSGYDAAEDYVFMCDGGVGLSGSERYSLGSSGVQGDVSLILADTAEVQAELADGGRTDLILGTIAVDVAGLDGASMRGTDGAYTGTPPSASTIAAAVLDEAKGTHAGHVAQIPTNPYTGTPPTVEQVRAEMDSHSTQLALIVEDTGELQTNQGNWLTASGFATQGSVDAIAANVLRALGLLQENYYLDQTVYSGSKLTSGRLRTYSVAASVGTANDVLATYTITATWDGDNVDTYAVEKV